MKQVFEINKVKQVICDWVRRQREDAKFFGIVGGIIAAVVTPLIYVAGVNENEIDDVIKNLDKTPHSIFTSVEGCVAREFSKAACEGAKETAEKFASSLGSSLTYLSPSECTSKHSACSEITTTTTTNVDVGNNTTVPVTTTISFYYPAMMAWQMANNNPSLSVPLYTGTSRNSAVRKDGRVFALE